MPKMISTHNRVRVAALLVAVVAMLMGTMAISSAPADAQDISYARDQIEAPSDTCEAVGTIANSINPIVNGSYCRPTGFTPITTAAECEAVATSFSVLYAFSQIAESCFLAVFNTTDGACSAPSVVAPGDLILTNGNPFEFTGCGLVVLSDVSTTTPPMNPGSGVVESAFVQFAATTVCIDSADVQDDPAAAGLGVGETFVGSNGNRFSITTGGPTCTFTGAGCDASLNLDNVADVKTCLASLSAPALAAAPAGTAAAAPVAAVQAPAVAVAAPATELAQTGEEHERGAAFAGALVGTGVSVLALARLFVIRRRDADTF